MDFWGRLRTFLNKECIWTANRGSNDYCRIYTSSTAASPTFRMADQSVSVFNVTLIILKPKMKPHYITVYLNGQLTACCSPEAVFVKAVPGRYGFYLIYFGPFQLPADDVKIPTETAIIDKREIFPTFSDVLDMSKNVTGLSVGEALGPNFRRVGRCVFLNGLNICQFVLSPDFCPMLPDIGAFPSLGRMINLLTKCEDEDCVACYGKKIHANVYNGYSHHHADGTDMVCPCVCSCQAVNEEEADITGNRSLLSLLFPPGQQQSVVKLRFRDRKSPATINDILCGLTSGGEEVECVPGIWILLQHSQFLSRVQTYCCQILKRMVL